MRDAMHYNSRQRKCQRAGRETAGRPAAGEEIMEKGAVVLIALAGIT
jgi:hypothetical protein